MSDEVGELFGGVHYGTEINDIITTVAPVVYGLGGNDTIWGEVGFSTLLDGGSGNDVIDFRRDDGEVIVDLHAGTVNNGSIQINNFENIFGTAFDDTLVGNNGGNHITGEDGKDVIYGGGGNDFLVGGNDFDIIHGNHGNDTIQGGGGTDYLFGEEGDDVLNLLGLGGHVDGGPGNDILIGTFYTDFAVYSTPVSNAVIIAGAGNQEYFVYPYGTGFGAEVDHLMQIEGGFFAGQYVNFASVVQDSMTGLDDLSMMGM